MNQMKSSANAAGYLRSQIRLHWATVALLLLQWLSSQRMPGIMETLDAGATPSAIEFLLSTAHVYLGLSVLGLVVARLYLRKMHGVPAAPRHSGLLANLARFTHYGLYLMLVVMPVSGALGWFGVLPAAGHWHHQLGWVLILLIVLHTVAALWHHLIKQDGVMRRMLVPVDQPPSESD